MVGDNPGNSGNGGDNAARLFNGPLARKLRGEDAATDSEPRSATDTDLQGDKTGGPRRGIFSGKQPADSIFRNVSERNNGQAMEQKGVLPKIELATAANGPDANNDADVANLAGGVARKFVTELNLAGSAVTNDGLKSVANLGNLQKLDLSRTAVSDKGVQEITKLPLKDLNLSETAIDDDSVKSLARARSKVEHLNLDRTAVGTSGLESLSALTHLKELSLKGVDVLKGLDFEYEGPNKLPDNAYNALAKLGNLRRLDLTDAQNITHKQIYQLKNALHADCVVIGKDGKEVPKSLFPGFAAPAEVEDK